MAKLTPAQIQKRLKELTSWRKRGDTIWRTFQLADFVTAIKFVNRVAKLADAANHHPDIDIRWNKVTLKLSTHSEGGLTEKDFALAGKLDQAFAKSAGGVVQ
jgi:4a-hydroxytetrahydrobiopterin dehydratase